MRGSKEDCRSIIQNIQEFLTNLNLVLSPEKTQITNAKEEMATFLSVRIQKKNHRTFSTRQGILRRNVNNVRMTASIDKVTKKLTNNGFIKRNTPYPKFIWMQEEKDAIINLYNSVYLCIINYYRFTDNFNNLSSKVHFVLKNSCARLLAAKYKSTLAKIYKKYGKNFKGENKHGFIDIILGINTAAFNVETDDTMFRFNAS